MQDPFNFPEPKPANITRRLDLWATQYYIHDAPHDPAGEPLRDRAGNDLGPRLHPYEWCLGAIEGTVAVTDENCQKTIYNYGGEGPMQVDCGKYFPRFAASGKLRWRVANGRFGDGVFGMRLVPMRTIAIDGKQPLLKYRSVIYIPDARGAWVMTGSGEALQHDGYFYTADTGGALEGNHIDVFTVRPYNPFFKFLKSSPTPTFEAMIINDEKIATHLAGLHGGVTEA